MIKIKSIALIMFMIGMFGWTFLLSSCSDTPTVNSTRMPPESPTVAASMKSVGDSSKTVGETGADVGKRADAIDTHAVAISTATPPEAKAKIEPEVQGIHNETKGLREDQAILSATKQKLDDAQSVLAEQQKKIEVYTAFAKNTEIERTKLQAKIKDLESSNAKLLKTMLTWISVLCVIGIGISIVIGFFLKTPMAFMVAAGCLVTLGVSVAVSLYLQWIAIISAIALGISFLGAIAYVAMQIKNKNVAVKELVKTGEVAKSLLPTDARVAIFGDGAIPGIAHTVQSATTQNIVQQIRSDKSLNNSIDLAPPITISAPTVSTIPSSPAANSSAVFASVTQDNVPVKTILG